MIYNYFDSIISNFIHLFILISFFITTYYSIKILKVIYLFIFIKIYELKNKTKIIFITDNPIPNTIYILQKFGFNNFFLNINDNIKFKKIIMSIKKNHSLDIIVQANGGFISCNDHILNVMKNFEGNIKSYVFGHALSAATLIVLASNKIFMDKYATLGPTDPQIEINNNSSEINVSTKSFIELFNSKKPTEISDFNLITYFDNKSLYDINVNIVSSLVNKHLKNDYLKKEIVNKFSSGNIPHHTPFDVKFLEKYLFIEKVIPCSIRFIYEQIII